MPQPILNYPYHPLFPHLCNLGASLKDLGKKLFAFSKIGLEKTVIMRQVMQVLLTIQAWSKHKDSLRHDIPFIFSFFYNLQKTTTLGR